MLCIGGQTPDYTILSLDRASYFPDIDVTLGMTVWCRYIFALLWLADSYEYWSLIGPGQTRTEANPIQFVATELPTYLLRAVVSKSKLNKNYDLSSNDGMLHIHNSDYCKSYTLQGSWMNLLLITNSRWRVKTYSPGCVKPNKTSWIGSKLFNWAIWTLSVQPNYRLIDDRNLHLQRVTNL